MDWWEQLMEEAREIWSGTSIEIGGDSGGFWIGRRPGPTWAFVAVALFIIVIFFSARR